MTLYLRMVSVLGMLLVSTLAVLGQVEESSVSDTVEVKMKNRKYIIITDDEGRRIEIKDNNDEESEANGYASDDDFNWDDFENEDEDDFNENKKDRRKRKRSEIDPVAFDLGITNYYVDGTYGADAASPELELREFRPGAHVALHLFPTRVSLIGRGAVNLKTALTIDWSNYYFVNNINLEEEQGQLTITESGTEYSKNKLMARYFQVPLMLTFNTRPGTDDGVRIGVGGYGGLLWGARTKQDSEEFGVQKVSGDFGLNPYRYGLIFRFDFSWLDLYLHYNLSPMFEEGSGGPTTQTFMAGLNIIHF